MSAPRARGDVPQPRTASRSPDLARTMLQLLTLGALIATSLWIVWPFLIAVAWATMIAVATWPVLLQLQERLGGHRAPAVALMTVLLLLFLLVPLYFAITTIVANAADFVRWSRSVSSVTVPEPPQWVGAIPLVGARMAARWHALAAAGPDEIAARLAPYARTVGLWFVGHVGGVGRLLLQLLLTMIIVVILYARGDAIVPGVDRFASRLAGAQGEHAVHLAAQAVRAVALGIVVTAVLQSAVSGVGLAVAGVPYAAILTALVFVLAIAQIGAGPVLVPAVIWEYATYGPAYGTGLLVWAIFCMTFDNVARPLLIKRGADLPILLIFVGVIGGLIAFGVIGLFIGPVVLAVGYQLLAHWVSQPSASDGES